VVTAGVGIADDAPCFALAAVMFTGGLAMFKTVQGGERIPIEGEEPGAL